MILRHPQSCLLEGSKADRLLRHAATLLFPALLYCVAAASVSAQELRTEKEVYGPREEVTVVIGDSPGNRGDFVTIVPGGTKDGSVRQYRWFPHTDGTLVFPGLEVGEYEVRFHPDRTRRTPAARHVFAVRDSTAPEILVETSKPVYRPEEPIEVRLSGTPGNSNDWITVVPNSMPEGRHAEWKWFKETDGTVIFRGLRAGDYEARLHLRGTHAAPVARVAFRVGDTPSSAGGATAADGGIPPADAAATAYGREYEVEPPTAGLQGSWLGYVQCSVRRTREGERFQTHPAMLELSGEGPVAAELYLLWSDANGLRLTGAFDDDARRLTLEPVEWIYRPSGPAAPIGVDVTLNDAGLRLDGRITNVEGCEDFQAFKFVRDHREPAATGLIPTYAKYGAAAVTSENCVAYLHWTIEGEQIQTQDTEVPSQILDGNSFYRTLGKTYDDWAYPDKAVVEQFWSRCISHLLRSKGVTERAVVEQALRTRQVGTFLIHAMPTAGRPDKRGHTNYLRNYALVAGLRVARFHAEIGLAEAAALAATRGNLDKLAGEIRYMQAGLGRFGALSEDARSRHTRLLEAQKDRISGVLADEAFASFDIARYPRDLNDLKAAWAERSAVVAGVRAYATASQLSGLEGRFDALFASLSASIAGQMIAALPPSALSVQGVPQAISSVEAMEKDAVDYLADRDRNTALAATAGWYRGVAEWGHAVAQHELGIRYEIGLGVPQDFPEAAKWYLAAAEQGLADARFRLGIMHHEGRGVPQDDALAVTWFRGAADQGHAAARYNIGVMYHNSRGVPRDEAEATRWFQLAAEQGNVPAQETLAALAKRDAPTVEEEAIAGVIAFGLLLSILVAGSDAGPGGGSGGYEPHDYFSNPVVPWDDVFAD